MVGTRRSKIDLYNNMPLGVSEAFSGQDIHDVIESYPHADEYNSYGHYVDAQYNAGSPQTISAGVPITFTVDAQGLNQENVEPGVDPYWDVIGQVIKFPRSQEKYETRLNFTFKPDAGSDHYVDLHYEMATPVPIFIAGETLPIIKNTPTKFNRLNLIFVGSTMVVAGLRAVLTFSASGQLYDKQVTVFRT